MSAITIEAPAKLNLHLKVGGRRPDGFHDIESLFLALAFGDTLYFETTPSGTTPDPLEITMNRPVSGENIISRAVSLFRERTGFDQGLKVTVEKRIPPGGGLGGGSSNAAAALLALNCLASDGIPLVNDADLAEMGASLGSDVPFFLHRASAPAFAAWVTGRGEQIQPLELPESAQNLAFVLVNPGFPSDTAEAYRLLDSRREGSGEWGVGNRDYCSDYDIAPELYSGSSNHALHSLISTPHSPLPTPHFFNDFLPVLAGSDKGAVYQRIIGELRDVGAEFAGLSGSGSTCFGVFSGREQAESARDVLLKRWPFVIFTFPLVCGAIPCYNSK
jgi:4-diphosphocytidyl-2-C-methyl-D-erythritol kinase